MIFEGEINFRETTKRDKMGRFIVKYPIKCSSLES